ncbi:MAG: hypothetical protein DME38_00580 [Verrucomicrobia bacterium]|nr:MAG: hypothetical protein DME38_00580 [Verrucomicrobiota bacterium]
MGANSAFRSALPCPKKATETMPAIRGNSGERLLRLFSGGFGGLITVDRKSKTAASLGSGRSSLNRGNFYLVLLP